MEEKVKCIAFAGVGALLGSVSTIYILKLLSRKGAFQCGKKSIEFNVDNNYTATGVANHGLAGADLLTDEIVCEQLTRNIQFFGLESQKKVCASYVVVIGLGGVGSHAASMLLRSGVGKLLIVLEGLGVKHTTIKNFQ